MAVIYWHGFEDNNAALLWNYSVLADGSTQITTNPDPLPSDADLDFDVSPVGPFTNAEVSSNITVSSITNVNRPGGLGFGNAPSIVSIDGSGSNVNTDTTEVNNFPTDRATPVTFLLDTTNGTTLNIPNSPYSVSGSGDIISTRLSIVGVPTSVFVDGCFTASANAITVDTPNYYISEGELSVLDEIVPSGNINGLLELNSANDQITIYNFTGTSLAPITLNGIYILTINNDSTIANGLSFTINPADLNVGTTLYSILILFTPRFLDENATWSVNIGVFSEDWDSSIMPSLVEVQSNSNYTSGATGTLTVSYEAELTGGSFLDLGIFARNYAKIIDDSTLIMATTVSSIVRAESLIQIESPNLNFTNEDPQWFTPIIKVVTSGTVTQIGAAPHPSIEVQSGIALTGIVESYGFRFNNITNNSIVGGILIKGDIRCQSLSSTRPIAVDSSVSSVDLQVDFTLDHNGTFGTAGKTINFTGDGLIVDYNITGTSAVYGVVAGPLLPYQIDASSGPAVNGGGNSGVKFTGGGGGGGGPYVMSDCANPCAPCGPSGPTVTAVINTSVMDIAGVGPSNLVSVPGGLHFSISVAQPTPTVITWTAMSNPQGFYGFGAVNYTIPAFALTGITPVGISVRGDKASPGNPGFITVTPNITGPIIGVVSDTLSITDTTATLTLTFSTNSVSLGGVDQIIQLDVAIDTIRATDTNVTVVVQRSKVGIATVAFTTPPSTITILAGNTVRTVNVTIPAGSVDNGWIESFRVTGTSPVSIGTSFSAYVYVEGTAGAVINNLNRLFTSNLTDDILFGVQQNDFSSASLQKIGFYSLADAGTVPGYTLFFNQFVNGSDVSGTAGNHIFSTWGGTDSPEKGVYTESTGIWATFPISISDHPVDNTHSQILFSPIVSKQGSNYWTVMENRDLSNGQIIYTYTMAVSVDDGLSFTQQYTLSSGLGRSVSVDQTATVGNIIIESGNYFFAVPSPVGTPLYVRGTGSVATFQPPFMVLPCLDVTASINVSRMDVFDHPTLAAGRVLCIGSTRTRIVAFTITSASTSPTGAVVLAANDTLPANYIRAQCVNSGNRPGGIQLADNRIVVYGYDSAVAQHRIYIITVTSSGGGMSVVYRNITPYNAGVVIGGNAFIAMTVINNTDLVLDFVGVKTTVDLTNAGLFTAFIPSGSLVSVNGRLDVASTDFHAIVVYPSSGGETTITTVAPTAIGSRTIPWKSRVIYDSFDNGQGVISEPASVFLTGNSPTLTDVTISDAAAVGYQPLERIGRLEVAANMGDDELLSDGRYISIFNVGPQYNGQYLYMPDFGSYYSNLGTDNEQVWTTFYMTTVTDSQTSTFGVDFFEASPGDVDGIELTLKTPSGSVIETVILSSGQTTFEFNDIALFDFKFTITVDVFFTFGNMDNQYYSVYSY